MCLGCGVGEDAAVRPTAIHRQNANLMLSSGNVDADGLLFVGPVMPLGFGDASVRNLIPIPGYATYNIVRESSDTLLLEVNFSYTSANDTVTEWMEGVVRLPLLPADGNDTHLRFDEKAGFPMHLLSNDDEKLRLSFDLGELQM